MAGSVVVFDVSDDLDQDKLRRIANSGIGERRGEGFGRIRFNPPLLLNKAPANWENFTQSNSKNGQNANVSLDENSQEYKFAEHIIKTAWREEIKVTVLKIADAKNDLNAPLRQKIFGFDSNQKKPPMSQIGNLRSVVARVRRFEDNELVTNWLEHINNTENRREKWSNKSLQNIEELFIKKDKIWEILRNKGNAKLSESFIKEKEIENELWAEAVRALLYACQHAHKRDLEKKEKAEAAANG